MNLVEDAEDLVGIDRSQGEIVVGITAVIEVEAAHHVVVQKPGDDLLDVLRLVVMAGIDEDNACGPALRASRNAIPQSAMSV